jgi:TRAP-type C4-dicarboxylate transport system permease small subunit
MVQSMSDNTPLDPQAAATIARVRRLMLITMAITIAAVAFVFAVIGYRLFHLQESAPTPADVTAALPAGTKVLATAVGDGHIVLTVEVNGIIEMRTYDLSTLKPLGRLRLSPKP